MPSLLVSAGTGTASGTAPVFGIGTAPVFGTGTQPVFGTGTAPVFGTGTNLPFTSIPFNTVVVTRVVDCDRASFTHVKRLVIGTGSTGATGIGMVTGGTGSSTATAIVSDRMEPATTITFTKTGCTRRITDVQPASTVGSTYLHFSSPNPKTTMPASTSGGSQLIVFSIYVMMVASTVHLLL